MTSDAKRKARLDAGLGFFSVLILSGVSIFQETAIRVTLLGRERNKQQQEQKTNTGILPHSASLRVRMTT
jgi:hypothetical protein